MQNRKIALALGIVLVLGALITTLFLLRNNDAQVEQPQTIASQQAPAEAIPAPVETPVVEATAVETVAQEPEIEIATAPEVEPTTATLPPAPPVASLVPEATPTPAPESGVAITVIEEEGGPLAGAFVGLRRGDERRPSASARTESDGIAVLEDVEPGEYGVVVQWSTGPWHDGGTIRVAEGLTEETITYPARSTFRIQVVDPAGTPVPGEVLEISMAGGRGGWMGGASDWEQHTTDSEGFFDVRAHGTTRFFLVRSDTAAIYSAEFDDEWGNPYRFRRTFEPGQPGVLIKRDDVVEAIATVVNMPPALAGLDELEVSVRSDEYDYNDLDMSAGQFRFLGAVGSTVEINFTRRTNQSRRERIPSLLEKSVTEQLPDEPGKYEFEIAFEDRRTIGGVVVTPMREPVADIVVFAEAANPDGRGELRFFSTRTAGDGVFLIELPPSSQYAFLPVRQTMPDEYQGRTPVEKTWSELGTGEPLEIVLEASSLVWGTVVTAEGAPAPNAMITLQGDGVFWNSWQISTRSDDEGFFLLNIPPVAAAEYAEQGVTENSYVLAIDFQRGVGYTGAVIDSPDQPADIVLEPFVDTRVTVLAGGAPATDVRLLPQYHVPWRDEPFRPGMRPQRPEAGEPFVVRNLPRGMGSIVVTGTAPDGTEHTQTVRIPPDATSPLDVTVDLLGGVTVQ